MKKLISVIFMALMSIGCTNKVDNYPVSAIDIVPVNYFFELSANESRNTQPLSQKMKQYLEQNIALLIDNQITISWQEKQGEILAKQAKNWLQVQGVDESKLTITPMNDTTESSALITIAIDSFQVQTNKCQQSKMRALGRVALNCAVESSRWHAIAHPQRSLPAPAKKTKE